MFVKRICIFKSNVWDNHARHAFPNRIKAHSSLFVYINKFYSWWESLQFILSKKKIGVQSFDIFLKLLLIFSTKMGNFWTLKSFFATENYLVWVGMFSKVIRLIQTVNFADSCEVLFSSPNEINGKNCYFQRETKWP